MSHVVLPDAEFGQARDLEWVCLRMSAVACKSLALRLRLWRARCVQRCAKGSHWNHGVCAVTGRLAEAAGYACMSLLLPGRHTSHTSHNLRRAMPAVMHVWGHSYLMGYSNVADVTLLTVGQSHTCPHIHTSCLTCVSCHRRCMPLRRTRKIVGFHWCQVLCHAHYTSCVF